MASVSPWYNSVPSAATFGVWAAVWLIVVQWLSAALGGYLTGRLRTKWVAVHTDEVYFRISRPPRPGSRRLLAAPPSCRPTLVFLLYEHALRWADRIEATASLMPPEQAKIFKEIAEEETVLLMRELKRNPKALPKRLGVEIGKRSPPVVYQRQSIGEMAIRTAVRATVWELIFSLFRR
jgi:hypothetical protein